MNISSCGFCGVVYDKTRIPKPNIYLKDNEIDTKKAVWDGEEYAPIILCPNCKGRIRYDNGDYV